MANVLQWNSSTNSFSVSGASSVTQVVGEGIDNNFSVPQTFGAAINQTASAGANNQSALLNTADVFSDFIASGVQWSVPSPASLTAGMTSGSAYLNSVRTLVPAISGNAFPASNDTYVSFNNSGVPAYQSVANGAAAPTPASGYVQTAKVVTSPIQSPTATLSTSTSGSLASGTYGIALVAFDATGYGAVGASGTVAVTSAQSGSGSIEISWVNPLNETSMDIYATTAGSTTLGLVASGVTGTTYTYTGSVAPGAAAPTTATSNAVQSVDNLMTTVIIPNNTTKEVSITYNIPNGTIIQGSGQSSILQGASGLSQVISLGRNCTVSGLNIITKDQGSGGSAFSIDPNCYVQNITVNCQIDGVFCYVNANITSLNINGFSTSGLTVAGDDANITQVTSFSQNINAAGTGSNLVLQGNVQGLTVSDSEFIGGGDGLSVIPVSTALPVTSHSIGPSFNRFSNVFFDSSANGAQIDWSSDSVFDACWFSNRPGNGATVGTNFASGIQLIGCTFENSGSHGVAIASGAVNTLIEGCLIKGNNTENNGSYGIYVADNTKGFTISNNTITSLLGNSGTQTAAIYIGTGCDDYVIEGNYVLGNTATIIDNSKRTASNRKVVNNIGYDEFTGFIDNTDIRQVDVSASTVLTVSQAGTLVVWTGGSGDTLTLPLSNAAQFGHMKFVFTNQGSGPVTLAMSAGDATDLPSTLLYPHQQIALTNDGGALWITIWQTNGQNSPFVVGNALSSSDAVNLGQTNSLYQSSKLAVASTTTSGSITASAAQLAAGFLADGATQTAAFTVTTDTAANILAAMPNAAVGTSFKFRFINNDQSSTGYAGTLAGGTGVTVGSVLPNPAVPKGAYMDYLFTFTAVGSSPTLTVEAVGGNSSALL